MFGDAAAHRRTAQRRTPLPSTDAQNPPTTLWRPMNHPFEHSPLPAHPSALHFTPTMRYNLFGSLPVREITD